MRGKPNGAWYTVPMGNATVAAAQFITLKLTLATPEFGNPNLYATVQLSYLGNGVFDGGAILYYLDNLVRENRAWHVTVGP